MAKDNPDLDPDELEDLPAESPPAPRRSGLPDAVPEREAVLDDLSKRKEEMPAFTSQDRRQAKRLEGMDLEGADDEGLDEQIRPKTPKKPVRQPESLPRGTISAAAEGGKEATQSGRDVEEALRREAGRPKSNLRSSDFEPLAWESSRTKLDLPEHYDDGERPAPVDLRTCLGSVVQGAKRGWSHLNVIEMASVSAFLVVALFGLFFFRSLVHSVPEPESDRRPTLSSISLPLKGELVSVASIDANWREPKPGDLVRPGMLVVPEVHVQASGSGFLRILFRDELGKIRGDPFAVNVSGGGETYSVFASEGYGNKMKLVECRAGRLKPWQIDIYESTEYDVPIEQWNSLARFDVPSKITAAP